MADSVPASAGAVSLVMPPSATVPVVGATSSVIELITTVWVGAAGVDGDVVGIAGRPEIVGGVLDPGGVGVGVAVRPAVRLSVKVQPVPATIGRRRSWTPSRKIDSTSSGAQNGRQRAGQCRGGVVGGAAVGHDRAGRRRHVIGDGVDRHRLGGSAGVDGDVVGIARPPRDCRRRPRPWRCRRSWCRRPAVRHRAKVQPVPATLASPILSRRGRSTAPRPAPKMADSVPASAGAVSLVMPPSATVPVVGATSSVMVSIVTVWVGALVSMVMS